MPGLVSPCPCRSWAEHKAQDLPHLEYPWGRQDGVRRARALRPAALVALVHVLPVPYQSRWLNSSAVIPLPTAEIWRGVWRCLAQSQCLGSTRKPTWLATLGKRNQTPPKLLLRKPALSTSSLTASAPQTMSFLQCLSSPRAP